MVPTLSFDDLRSIADEFGTPLYVYHAERIKFQYERLQQAFPGISARFFYACKALTNISILRYIRQIGLRVDCSSINEVWIAIQAGFQPSEILYTSNSIHFSEIETARSLGVHINIDSLSNLEKFGRAYGNSYPVGIRLRPNIMAGGNLKISTGHPKSKFGIPIEYAGEVLSLAKTHDLHIRGLQIHTGSEIGDIGVFAKGIEVLFEVAMQFPDLEFIDLGGGLKVPYQPGEKGTDIEALGKKVAAEFKEFNARYFRPVEVWLEPGKYFVSEAGYFIARVNVLKQTPDTCFAGIDTGLNHLIRPMFYGAYHHIENISNPNGQPKAYTIVGNICETDTFAEDRPIAEIREGDYLVIYNAGAYGYEMASNYNSRLRPGEVMLEDGKARLIRKRETLDDLIRNQVEFFPG